MKTDIKKNKNGSMLVLVIVATGLFLVLLLGAITLSLLQQKLNKQKVASAQALHIAEAGVNYYRWVLYHNHEEYCNDETCQIGPDYGPYGPYPYMDSAGESITGYYELYITPPPLNGSTIVNIKSIGWSANYPNIKRSIEVNCGISSWSTYSTLANAFIRFGAGTEVWGPIHSNGGIRFDGLAHNVISSSEYKYNDPDHTGGDEYGVHTHIHAGGTYDTDELCDEAAPPCDPSPNDYSDVFMAGREFPVNVVSFNLLDSYASEVYSKATSSGIVFDGAPTGTADADSEAVFWDCATNGNSCDSGFHITLKTDNTFDIRGVTSLRSDCSGSPSNSINTEDATIRNYAIPTNGIIFIKHTIWVDGQIDNNGRVSIIAFKEPFVGGNADININNDILYSHYDGTETIGLIAQRDINVGLYSENDLRIDAALLAKTGRIGRDYYGGCANSSRDTITVYGSLATNQRYGFAWTDGTGYTNRNLIYDNNLTFAPPPHYPTTGEYTFISWKEE